MMKILRSDQCGVAIVELAIALPFLILFLCGTLQLGELLFARADLGNAISSGARVASVYPRPSDEIILEAITEQIAGLDQSRLVGPTVESKLNPDGLDIIEITISYDQPIDFILFETSPVRLQEMQRVFIQPGDS